MLSDHSQVSSEGKSVAAEPKLWSITSEITKTVSHVGRKREEGDRKGITGT